MAHSAQVPKYHPQDEDLASLLAGSLAGRRKKTAETHLASCDECLGKTVIAYESVAEFRGKPPHRKDGFMRRFNIYLVLAVTAFALSFIMPQYFLQMLVATLLLGLKWVVDSKTTKMLIMIHEAWKSGGGKEAGRIMDTLTPRKL
jgi:hypothetical protein